MLIVPHLLTVDLNSERTHPEHFDPTAAPLLEETTAHDVNDVKFSSDNTTHFRQQTWVLLSHINIQVNVNFPILSHFQISMADTAQ